MKTQRTFKPGDYCRFSPEEIPTIIAILKANGWKVWDRQNERYTSKHNVIWCDVNGELGSFINVNSYCKSELSKHDFMVTALRLSEGHGLRADKSTPEQREHIAKTLEKLGVKVGELTNVKTIGVGLTFHETEFCFFGTRHSEINHVTYSDWCKRLNETPINQVPDVGEKVLPSLEKEYEETGYTAWVGSDVFPEGKMYTPAYTHWLEKKVIELRNKNTLTLPDGTTVDLTKPLEVSYGGDKWENDELEFHFVGFNNAGHIIVECLSDCELQAVDKIRNKPEPEFKQEDKLKDLDEDLKAFIVSNLPDLNWVGSDSCASAFLCVDEDGVIEDSLMLSLSKAVIACSNKPFSLSIRPVESEVLLYYID